MSEPEFGTEHTEAHNVVGGLEPHDHGTGPGQHVHGDWVPDKVVARLKRDGFCGEPVSLAPGGPTGHCMRRDDHEH